jgi:CRISPR system Cascade subunit CasE
MKEGSPLYLSQLTLNPLDWQARLDISNPYEMHRSLMRGFPSPLPADERILFRLETIERNGAAAVVLIQSIFSPDWLPLANRENYLLLEPSLKSLEALHFQSGQVLQFRLRANPSKRNTTTGKREGVYDIEDRLAWLERKADQGGFAIAEGALNIQEANFRSFTARKKASPENLAPEKPPISHNIPLTINMVDYEGYLEIQDTVKFFDSLKLGIGPAKGLGCGLLSIAPA